MSKVLVFFKSPVSVDVSSLFNGFRIMYKFKWDEIKDKHFRGFDEVGCAHLNTHGEHFIKFSSYKEWLSTLTVVDLDALEEIVIEKVLEPFRYATLFPDFSDLEFENVGCDDVYDDYDGEDEEEGGG